MSDEKHKVTDKAGEIAKNIWLAGVGAYGKAVEDAQGRLEKAMEPPKLFRDLVKAGAALEEGARGAQKSSSTARHSVEERITKVRDNFYNQRPARTEDLMALHDKVDKLTKKVEQLTKALASSGISADAAANKRKPRTTAKTKVKASTRKPSTKKTKTKGKVTTTKRSKR